MDFESEWGTYSPPKKSWLFRAIISLGLARGMVRKKLLFRWRQSFGPTVDFQKSGIKFRLNLEDNVTDGRILTSLSRYDRTEMKSLVSSCKNGVFVDIGANIGFYSIIMAANGSNVIAIEPNPKTLARLNYNVSLNDFANKITVLPLGVGEEGDCELTFAGDLGSASTRTIFSRNKKTIKISTFPLLDILESQNIEKVDGLKIDIEGTEDIALIPFFKDSQESLWPRCLVIEHCNRIYWQNDVIKFILNLGYYVSVQTRSNTIIQKKIV